MACDVSPMAMFIEQRYAREEWSMDKLTITDGFGKEGNFCKEEGEVLLSGIPITRWLTSDQLPKFSLLLSENFNWVTVMSPTKNMP